MALALVFVAGCSYTLDPVGSVDGSLSADAPIARDTPSVTDVVGSDGSMVDVPVASDASSIDASDGGDVASMDASGAMDGGTADTSTTDVGSPQDVVPTDAPLADAANTDTGQTDVGAVDTGPACPSPQLLCGGMCTNTNTDGANCGACGRACGTTTGYVYANVATYGCASSACTIASCTAGYADCNGLATDGCETNLNTMSRSCGACGHVCALAHTASDGCVAGSCTFVSCLTGFANCDGIVSNGCEVDTQTDNANCGACSNSCAGGMPVCVSGACSAPPAPRLIAPLSTATVTSQTPTLHWQLAPGTTGAHIAVCTNRAMTLNCVGQDATGSSAALTSALTSGVHFWQLYGRSGGTLGTAVSQTWEFFVGHLSASVDTSSGTVADFNGDGYADVVVGANNSNTAYVYLGGMSGLASTPTTLIGPGSSGNFGWSVSSAGDVNGDGYADLIIGANLSNTAYVYLGGASGLAATPAILDGTIGFGGTFGGTVASAGDVNGDGYADVLVALGGSNSLYVYFGSLGWPTATRTTLTGPSGSHDFGYSASSAGDVNGDGYADVVVGENCECSGGTAYVYLGGAGGLATIPTTLTGPSGDMYFGISVASAGDVNGDGYPDVVVGTLDSNTAYVYLGGAGGLATTPTTMTVPSRGGGNDVVASAGDVNGDGYADVIATSDTRAYVFFGGSGGLATTTPTTLTGISEYGYAVGSAGDVNGDGYGDLVIAGDPASSYGVFVYLGGTGGPSTSPTTLTVPIGSGGFGASVARAGFDTGDGTVVTWPRVWAGGSAWFHSCVLLGLEGSAVTHGRPHGRSP